MVGILVFQNAQPKNFGGLASGWNVFSGGVTNSSTSVGIAATVILARDTDRQYASFCNYDAGLVALHFTLAGADMDIAEGILISSSTNYRACYEIDSDNLYIGEVYGIADATTIISILYK